MGSRKTQKSVNVGEKKERMRAKGIGVGGQNRYGHKQPVQSPESVGPLSRRAVPACY